MEYHDRHHHGAVPPALAAPERDPFRPAGLAALGAGRWTSRAVEVQVLPYAHASLLALSRLA